MLFDFLKRKLSLDNLCNEFCKRDIGQRIVLTYIAHDSDWHSYKINLTSNNDLNDSFYINVYKNTNENIMDICYPSFESALEKFLELCNFYKNDLKKHE